MKGFGFKLKTFSSKLITLFILIACTLFIVTPGLAQIKEVCGRLKIKVDDAAIKKAQQYIKAQTNQRIAASPTAIKVYFHILRNDDGTNAAATESEIQQELNQLTTDYSADNICFYNTGLNYINCTHINLDFDVSNLTDVALLNQYLVPQCINVFYHSALKSIQESLGGYAYMIPNTFCSIAKINIGKMRTISHEVGHCFGLYHTFEGCNLTFINGFSCDITGDFVCDTEADPYCYKLQNANCFSSSDCSYTGACTDAAFQTNWSPPYDNIMSYWGLEKCNLIRFTGGQFNRVNAFLNTDLRLISCKSPDNDVISSVNVSNGYYMASAVNQLSTSGSINISGTANASFAAKQVLITPGFRAFPSDNGLVLITSSDCNFSASGLIAKSKIEHAYKDELLLKKVVSSLSVFPNPASSLVNIEYNLAHREEKAILQAWSINQKVKELPLYNLKAGRSKIQLNISDLPVGMYYLILQANHKRLTTKFVIAR